MKTYKPPYSIEGVEKMYSVFLAGSIEMGTAENWQQRVEDALKNESHLCLLNPRRDDWNATWKQEITNPDFMEQVSWELDALEKADLIVFYFSPQTKSPVSMLELGLFAKTGKVIVCCPEGFWRKGNIDIVCERYKVKQVNTIDELIDNIKTIYYHA